MEACCRLRAAWKNPTDENDAWHDTFTATQIQCDSTAKNVIPGNASLILNIRYTQPDTEDSILARIREITGLDDVEPLMSDYALPVIGDETCPFLQKVLSVSSEVRGRRLAFAKMNGATDSRHVVQLCPGIPVLVSGCRHGAIHALGEWLDLADYDRMIEIFNRIVRESN